MVEAEFVPEHVDEQLFHVIRDALFKPIGAGLE